jgi:signal peptidase I
MTMTTDDTHNTPTGPETETFGKSAESEWMELLSTAFWAIAVALVIRTFLFEPFNIPSGSMKPNLLIGDYLFVSKYSYGYSRYSLPFGLPLIPGPGRVMEHAPKQGDVAVFKLPTNPRTDYIKRVIGTPGDHIQMRRGRLYLNGKLVPREAMGVIIDSRADGDDIRMTVYEETLPDGVEHTIYEEGDNGPLDNTKEYVVPQGHYFMMGDNRDNSQDSRVEDMVGYVPVQNFVGKAERIFFSTNGNAHFWEVWKWPATVRYTRLLMSVQ